MTGVRHRVPGRWHPKIDVNAVSFDNEPQAGLAIGDWEADTLRVVSDDMGALIRQQEMCWRCLCEFPCSMRSPERYSRWGEVIDKGEFRVGGSLTRNLALSRVRACCCPMCGVPISDETIQTQVHVEDVRR